MSAPRASCSPSASPARSRAASPVISFACSRAFPTACARPSPSTTAPSSPVTWPCTTSRSRLSSATLTRLGRRAASRTRSAGCGASFPARPILPPCQAAASAGSSPPTTTRPANALTSGPRQRPFPKCCTSSVNPPPGFRQDDDNHNLRNATLSTTWSAPFLRINVARGRVGKMLSSRLARLVRSQIAMAVAVASSSDSSA
jgi:hypothetical protein